MQIPQLLRKIEIKPLLLLAGVTVLSYLFTVAIRGDKLKLGSVLGQGMWYYYPRDVRPKLWFPHSVFVATMAYFLLIKRWLTKGNLGRLMEVSLVCGLVLMVFVLNMSVFSLSMFGLDELPQVIVHSGRTSFFTDAVKVQDVQVFLRGYAQQVKNLTHHSQVHGPGPILLFWSVYKAFGRLGVPYQWLAFLNKFLNLNLGYLRNLLVSSGMPGDNAAIYTSLFMGAFFPFAASMTIVPLYYLGKLLYDKTTALFACGVFATMPAVFLFTPQLAQFLLLLGVAATWLFLKSLKDGSAPLAALAGLIFAVSLLFGLELLALVPLWVGTALFFKRIGSKDQAVPTINAHVRTGKLHKMMLVFLSSAFLFFAVLFALFKFNAVESYRNSMAIHNILEARRPYSKWIWANFLEYFVFLGVPVTVLFSQKLVRQFKGIRTRRVDVFFLSFVITLIVLDLSGVNRGEVARLWMFLLPFMALFVASEIRSFGVTISPGFLLVAFLIILSLGFSYALGLKSVLLTLPLTLPRGAA